MKNKRLCAQLYFPSSVFFFFFFTHAVQNVSEWVGKVVGETQLIIAVVTHGAKEPCGVKSALPKDLYRAKYKDATLRAKQLTRDNVKYTCVFGHAQ